MSKSFRYVKDFEFPTSAGFSSSTKGYCDGGKVMKKAEGGTVAAKTAKPAKVERPIAAGKREGYMRSHPPGSDAARMIARNERVMESRPHKAERLGAVNAALKKNPNMTREQVADLKDSFGPAKNKPAPNRTVMKKADGGGVTINEAGERLFVSRPASTTASTTTSTTATKTLSKRDQRRAQREQQKKERDAARDARGNAGPGRKVLPATAGTGYKAATGTGTTASAAMAKATGGSVSTTAKIDPRVAQQTARKARQAEQDAANKKRVAAQKMAAQKKQEAHDAADDPYAGKRIRGSAANLAWKASLNKKSVGLGDGKGRMTTGTTTVTKANGGSVRPALRAASQPLSTRQYSSETRQYTPAENQQRAIARRAQMDKQDAARKAAHDARVTAAAKRKTAHDAANDARKGMNKPGATAASAAMAKAHGGMVNKPMTKAARGGVPAHSNMPMIRKPANSGVSDAPAPKTYLQTSRGKISADDYGNLSPAEKMTYAPVPAKKSRR